MKVVEIMKNYGLGHCLFCGEKFTKNSHNQQYCKGDHITECFDCAKKYNFNGSPEWLRGVKNKNTPYYCESCIKINSRNKARATKIIKYGDANYSNKDKARKTMVDRYGAPTTLQSQALKEKFKNTMVERYGGEYIRTGRNAFNNSASKRANIQNISFDESLYISKIFSSDEKLECWLKKYRVYKNKDKFTYGEISIELGASVTELSHVFSKYSVLKRDYIKLKDSKLELIVVKYIEDNFNVNFKRRLRPIDGFELDIYFPELKLAFEVNDFATHSKNRNGELLESFKNKGRFKKGPIYHHNKSIKCAEVGVELIHIWEDEILSGEYKNIINEKFKNLGVYEK